jgi:hypothetical protein
LRVSKHYLDFSDKPVSGFSLEGTPAYEILYTSVEDIVRYTSLEV